MRHQAVILPANKRVRASSAAALCYTGPLNKLDQMLYMIFIVVLWTTKEKGLSMAITARDDRAAVTCRAEAVGFNSCDPPTNEGKRLHAEVYQPASSEVKQGVLCLQRAEHGAYDHVRPILPSLAEHNSGVFLQGSFFFIPLLNALRTHCPPPSVPHPLPPLDLQVMQTLKDLYSRLIDIMIGEFWSAPAPHPLHLTLNLCSPPPISPLDV